MTKIKDVNIYARAFFRFKNLSEVKIKQLAAELRENEYRLTGLLRAAKKESSIVDRLLEAGYSVLDIPEGFAFTDYHLWLRKEERKKEGERRIEPIPEPETTPASNIIENRFIPHSIPTTTIWEQKTNQESTLRKYGFDQIISYDDFVPRQNAATQSTRYWDARSARAPINFPNNNYVDNQEEKEEPFTDDMKFIMEMVQKPALADLLIQAMNWPREVYEANQNYINEFMLAIIEADMKASKSKSEKMKPKKVEKKNKKHHDVRTQIQEWNYRNRNY